MAAYLIDHRPTRSQFRSPRRQKPSGVIAVHTAENVPDWVAFDGGAEAVARFIQKRTDPGSYHTLVDSDSRIRLVDYTDEAFHDGTGTNPHSMGLSVATRADVWPLAPQRWRDGAIEQAAQAAADYARWIHTTHGIVIPAERITAEEARNRRPGFVSHAQLDPTRRTDPGRDFPWSKFLNRYSALMGNLPKPKPTPVAQPMKDDDMAYIIPGTGGHPTQLWSGPILVPLPTTTDVKAAEAAGCERLLLGKDVIDDIKAQVQALLAGGGD